MRQTLPTWPPDVSFSGHRVESICFEPGKRESEVKHIRNATPLPSHRKSVDTRAASMAADLPKEGTFNSTYSAFGTIKVTTIGKERVMFVFDENGLTRSDGFLDHTTTKLGR
jgi:hypothetical protein